MSLYYLVKLLHVASMAAWLGAALWAPGDIRRAMARGKPDVDALAERVGPALRLDLWAGVATVVTGLVLFAWTGRPRLGLEIGGALGFGLLALVAAGIVPTWRRIATRLAAADEGGVAPLSHRFAALAGVGHVLWFLALALMVLPV
jgi:hypothetical protein